MKKMKRMLSVLLTICMLAVMLPVPALTEADAPVLMQVAQSALAGEPEPQPEPEPETETEPEPEPEPEPAPQPEPEMETETETEPETEPANTSTADSTDEATGTPAPVPTDETTGTPAPAPTDEATGTPAPVPTDEATGTPAPAPTDEASGTPAPTDEASGTPAPVPTDETTGTPAPVPTDEASGTPAPVPTDEASGTPAPTDEATGTPAPVPTDAAEVKTIASFEAVAPEGFAVPQGTLETDLGLPASLNAQFTDGAAGEVAVTWQCAAGYDPSAEAGTQFIFAAVLPEGYALLEGVSLPQILVTLTPPLANAMLMAQASGTGWTLSEDGKLTVTGYVMSSTIDSFESDVTSIEVAENASFTFEGMSFPGDITVQADGELVNSAGGTLSGDITLQGGSLNNYGALSGSVTIEAGGEMYNSIGGTLSCDITVKAWGALYNDFYATLSCDVTVETDGYFDNYGVISGGEISGEVSNRDTISGGIFSGEVNNRGTITDGTFSGKVDNGGIISGGKFTGTVINRASITGGNFTGATVTNDSDATSVTGGVFNGFTMDSKTNTLTITGDIDLSNGTLAPLTIALDEVSKIVVNSGTSFNAGSTPVSASVECNGAITGGKFTGTITGTGKLEGGDFTGADLDGFDGATGEGANVYGYFIENGKLTVTDTGVRVYSSAIPSWDAVTSIEVTEGASFALDRTASFSGSITVLAGQFINYGDFSGDISVASGGVFANYGTISGGTIIGTVTNSGSITDGDFTSATVKNIGDATVTGGTFSNVAFDGTLGRLTVTGNVDLDEGDALDPLTISQTRIASVVVAEGGTFDAGSASFLGLVTNNGTITGGTFTGPVTNSGEITGGTFTASVSASPTEPGVITGGTFENVVVTSPGYVISGGDFKNATVTGGGGIINGGTFSSFTMDSETGELTITGTVDLSVDSDALAPLTITLDDKSIQSITVEANATFNAEGNTVDDPVTCNGKITGGMFTGKITGTGTITGGDFSGADISDFTGVLTGGTFAGFTISDTNYGRTLTITGQNFDLTEIGLASFGLQRVVVAEGASVSDADLSGLTGITFQNYGEISGGTFEDMNLENDGAITGGTFYDSLSNNSTITNATIKDLLANALNSTVTGCQIDGLIYNSGTIEGCTFGENADVRDNTGTIEATMTVNGADATFEYDENILSALETTFGEGDWHAVVDGEQKEIPEDATFGLQKQSYACAHYVGTDDEGKKVLYITTPTEVTDDMLEGISTIVVAAGGAITGGELNGDASMDEVIVDVDGGTISGGTFSGKMSVRNRKEITGGTFNGYVWNYATISGGTFNGGIGNSGDTVIQGADGGSLRIDCAIQYYDESSAQILQPCAFGPNASISPADVEGTIEVAMTVNGENKTFHYGDNVLDALNAIRSGADWCAVEGDTRTPVKAEDAFGLQSCSYDYTYYVDGSILFITAPVEVTGDMLEGIDTIDVKAAGEITGGTLNSDGVINIAVDGVISGGSFSGNTSVQNWNGEITGGTFDCFVSNCATISGGAFHGSVGNSDLVGNEPVIQGKDGRVPEINGWIFSDASTAKILQPCDFGPNASVAVNKGVIEVVMTVNGADRTFDFDEEILPALEKAVGAGAWCLEEGETRTPVEAGDAFGLQKRSYVSTYYVNGTTLYITAPTEVTDEMLAGISTVDVTATGEITGGELNGDATINEVTVDVHGAISGGTFSGKMSVRNQNQITGGTFNGIVWNYATIRGGTFNGSVGNMGNAVIQGADESVPQINGNIYYNEPDAQILQPCAFGANATVTAENNKGAIQVSMTVNGADTTFEYGEKVLDALNAIQSGADWCAVEGDTRMPVTAEDAFGLQRCSYDYTCYPNGSWLYITAPVFLSQDMIPDGVWRIKVTQTGEITGSREPVTASIEIAEGGKISGGEFAGDIYSGGTISGGAFSGKVTNNGTVTGGTFDGTVENNLFISGGVFNGSVLNSARDSLIQGDGETTPELNGEISNKNDYYEPQILQPCDFGPNATVKENTGTIEVMVTVDGVETVVNYGADILKTLGASTTGLWYRERADGTRALVKEGEAFASLQGETYTSQVLLPTPKIEIDYRNESWSVTLTKEEVPEGVDVTAMDINFALSGEKVIACADMSGLSVSGGLDEIGGIWGMTFPTDKDITLEIFYSFAVTDANGNETDVAYGESVEWVIPARPDINVDTVYPGYNEMTVTLDAEPYEVYLESVDGSTVIYDADDGVVDGCIHGLTEGTGYLIRFRKLATENSFASFKYGSVDVFTTLTRTRLSVEAAETSWSWRPGFSLTAEDCFTAQIATEGEVKELPEKGKFTLSAVNEYGEPVSFPLTNAGTYTVTASLAEDVANDYRLENGGVFTVTIAPLELPAPVITIDYERERLYNTKLPETLPEGIEWESLALDLYANGEYIISVPPVLAEGGYNSLIDLAYWYGETLPPAAGEEDVVFTYCLSHWGEYRGNVAGQVSELVIPARPEADAPDSDARANAVTWNSIKMLDAEMLAEYDLGVALRGDELPAEPTIVDEDGDGLITGLAEGTEYCLYFRKKATDSSFRSEWYARSDIWVSTYRRPALSAGMETAEYTWTPDFKLDVAGEITFTRADDGSGQSVPKDDYTLAITDASGAQVTGKIYDAGTYTVKVTMESDNYVLSEGGDSFTITVRPLDLSSADVKIILPAGRVPMPVYTGKSVYPQIEGNMLEVELNGVYHDTLPADCFTIEAAEGRNNVNAGEAYLTIVGQGNATGETELAYTIIAKSIAD